MIQIFCQFAKCLYFCNSKLEFVVLCNLLDSNIAIGKMAERSNAAVLKTVDLHGSGGSNPSLSAAPLKAVS